MTKPTPYWRYIAGVSMLACASSAMAKAVDIADTIVVHANVYTVDAKMPHATAIAIKDGRFLIVGSEAAVRKVAGPATRVVDAHGRFVMPGFIDSHTHILGGGLYKTGVQLLDARTLAEVQARVSAFAKAHPEKPWIVGQAFSLGYPDMPGGAPTAAMIDTVVSDRPVLLDSGVAHAALANSKALAMAGITAKTPDPKDGSFVRDAQGNPTGWMKENASALIIDHIPKQSEADVRAEMLAAMQEAARDGITRLVSCGGDWDTLPVLAAFEAQGALLTRFSISDWAWPGQVDDAFVQKMVAGRARYHDDWLTTGAVKFMEDGVVESHTAFLPGGYADAPDEKGVSFWGAQQQTAAVIRLTKLGFQIYTHAIGDGAIHQTLDAYEAAEAAGAPKGLRNRVEHFEAPYASDIPRLVRLGVIASIQPVMIYPKDQWMGMEGMWQKYAGADRATRAYPIRTILAAGGHIAFGTDWPVVDLNPLLGIRDAVVRQSYDGEPKGGWMPREKISVAEAIKAYTLDSAYAAHRETQEGSITSGKLADFVILSDDLTAMAPDKIHTAKVLTTVVGGKVVYQAD